MKHLKTFENYDDMAMTCCPTCRSENCTPIAENRYECIDCGDVFVPEPPYMEEPYMEEEEDFMETPEVSADELDEYADSSTKISTIIANAEAADIELADQLKFEAEKADSYEDFIKAAEACIQDVKGVDREEAIAILNSLM